MGKTLIFSFFSLFLVCMAMGQDQTKLFAPVVIAGINDYTVLVLRNIQFVPREVVLVLKVSFVQDGNICPPFLIDGIRGDCTIRISLRSRETRQVVISTESGLPIKGWAYILYGVGNIEGTVDRVSDGVLYRSALIPAANRFELPVTHGEHALTAIGRTNDNGAFYSISNVLYELLDKEEKVVASTTMPRVLDGTQDALFLWQLFFNSLVEWEENFGPRFEGKLRVTSTGWPIALTTAKVVR